jgi:cell wall-associated NlpC family hydrolase
VRIRKWQLKKGDHIYAGRGTYEHHGIYIGHGRVIHYTKPHSRRARIGITSLGKFLDGDPLHYVSYRDREHRSRSNTVKRAYRLVGEKAYDLFGNNCEHMATWCRAGKSSSSQVQKVVGGLLAAASLLIVL